MSDRPAPDFSRPLEAMRASHECLLAGLDELEDLVSRLSLEGADAQARKTAAAVMARFDGKEAMHEPDEDVDLFPLLHESAVRLGRGELLTALRELELEHAVMRDVYAPLREQLAALAEGRSARLDVERVARFAWLCRRHIGTEASVILPFAGEALDEAARQRLGEQMAKRRRTA
ncbi:MAG: hemerythrin domain-containing protein [Betaproteobacteria bacterium]|nr:hemerythrin domain-containing protein [Betaproteobacteria bacterium]